MDFPGEKVLVRVIDTLEKGIGGVLRPWQIRRVGKANSQARMEERLLLEQADSDISKLKAGLKRFDSGKLIDCDVFPKLMIEGSKLNDSKLVDGKDVNLGSFIQAAKDAAQAREIQQAVNLKKIALFAEEEAEELDQQTESKQPSGNEDQPKVDADWFTKWRTGAQEISKEEMQRLWGKVLAGEVAQPGSYSLHAVEFLARMSSIDADILARIAPFATTGGIFKADQSFFDEHGIQFSDFLYLDELGLINATTGLGGIEYTLHHNDIGGRACSILYSNKHVIIFDMGETAKSPSKLTLEVYGLTRVCREILTLADFSPNLEYLQKICDYGISMGAEEAHLGMVHPDGDQILGLRTMAKRPVSPHDGN